MILEDYVGFKGFRGYFCHLSSDPLRVDVKSGN